MLSPANSLPAYGTLLGQTKSTLGLEKTEFHVFEIFRLSELVWIYDKVNKQINKYCHRHIKKRGNIELKLCMSEKLSMKNKKRSWINQKEQEEESYPKTINFSARSLGPPPPSSPSCIQEGKSILKRGVQNFPYLSPTVNKPFM